jgi:hypothetical protein
MPCVSYLETELNFDLDPNPKLISDPDLQL